MDNDDRIELGPLPGEPGWSNHDSRNPVLDKDEDWDLLTRREKALRVIDLCMSHRATLYLRLQAAKLALELEKKEPVEDASDAEFRKIVTQLGADS